MKTLAFRAVPWLIMGAVLGGVATAQTAATPPATAPTIDAFNRMVAPLTAASPSENLVALAKAAGINVLADVDDAGVPTPASAEQKPAEPAKEQTLFKALKELTNAQSWTWRRVAPDTVLLWKQPDFVALAQEIRGAQSAPTAPNFAADAPGAAANLPAEPLNIEPLNVALTRYFATPAAHDDPNNPASWREVPLLELPPELRDRVIASVRDQGSDLQFAASSAVLSDQWWQSAVLKIRELNVPKPRSTQTHDKRTAAEVLADIQDKTNLQKYLFVSGAFNNAGHSANTMLSLGRWEPENAAP